MIYSGEHGTLRQPSRNPFPCQFPIPNDKVARVSSGYNKRLLFRGWSRLCLHAASLNAEEGALAAASAAARATRAEAMEKEAKAMAEKAEAWRQAATAVENVEAWKKGEKAKKSQGRALQETELSEREDRAEKAMRNCRNRVLSFMVRSLWAFSYVSNWLGAERLGLLCARVLVNRNKRRDKCPFYGGHSAPLLFLKRTWAMLIA